MYLVNWVKKIHTEDAGVVTREVLALGGFETLEDAYRWGIRTTRPNDAIGFIVRQAWEKA